MRKLWYAWPFELKLAIAGGLVFLLSAAGTAWSGDRNQFPAWLGGVSTAFALLAAMFAARYAARVFVIEALRDERRDQAERRSQAALVAAWPAPFAYEWDYRDGHEVPVGIRTISAHLRNASPLPVTDVVVFYSLVLTDDDGNVENTYTIGSSGIGKERLAILPPTDTPIERYCGGVSEVDVLWVPDLDELERTELRVDFEFRDSAGTRWRRTSAGVLSELELQHRPDPRSLVV